MVKCKGWFFVCSLVVVSNVCMNTTNSNMTPSNQPTNSFQFPKRNSQEKRLQFEIIPFHCSPPPKEPLLILPQYASTHTHTSTFPHYFIGLAKVLPMTVIPSLTTPHSQTQHSLHRMFQPSYKHAIPQQNSATCVQRLDDSQNPQFTLLIALCYVLHRYTTQEIRR